MKKLLLLSGIAAMAFGFAACKGGSDSPKTQSDSLAYTAGYVMGAQFNNNVQQYEKMTAKDFDKDAFLSGLKTIIDCDSTSEYYLLGIQSGLQMLRQLQVLEMEHAGVHFNRDQFFAEFSKILKENPDSLNSDKIKEMAEVYQRLSELAGARIMQKQIEDQKRAEEEAAQKTADNKAAGEKYMKELIANDKDVKVTESGMAYKVEKMGTGAVAADTCLASVIYTGKFVNGEEFDSSKGEAVTFSPRLVVPGFKEALNTFPAGTKVTVVIPDSLGYGEHGNPPMMEGGQTLIFDLEIVDVTTPQRPAQKVPTTVVPQGN